MPRCVIKFGVNRQLIKEVKGDGLQELAREGLWRAALRWFRRILPDHFLPSAPRKYAGDYTPRTKVYQLRKARRHGHQRALTWTGTMRRDILKGTPKKELFKSAGAVRVRLRLPFARAANLWAGSRRVKSSGEVHNIHRELAAMTDGQRATIAGWVEQFIRRARKWKYETAGMKTERLAS